MHILDRGTLVFIAKRSCIHKVTASGVKVIVFEIFSRLDRCQRVSPLPLLLRSLANLLFWGFATFLLRQFKMLLLLKTSVSFQCADSNFISDRIVIERQPHSAIILIVVQMTSVGSLIASVKIPVEIIPCFGLTILIVHIIFIMLSIVAIFE